jgi:predicted kinase
MTGAGAVYIVVSGPPGSGKTTLAAPLAAELGLPLVAKDTIKDALMSVLPVPDVESSKLIGRASIAAMLAVAADAPFGAVLDCNFHRSRALDELGRLPGAIVEVFCRCDHDVAASRYLDRAPSRHPGHFHSTRSIDELWTEDVTQPVAGGWPVLEVDTNHPLDVTSLAASIQRRP